MASSTTTASSNNTVSLANMATDGHGTDGCSNCGATQSTDGTPLSTCAKCHSRKYCSRTCQAERWPFHKTFCGKPMKEFHEYDTPTPEQMNGYGIITAPLASSSPDHRNVSGHRMWNPAPPPGLLDSPALIDIPLSTAVGMPMRMLVAPATSALPVFSNGKVDALGIDIDPTSVTFAQIKWAPGQQPIGECLLTRVDEAKFHITHVLVLYRYALEGLGAVKAATMKEAAGKTVDRQALVAKYLNPRAFRIFFEEMKAAESGSDAEAWEGVECPVQVV